jgi:hypothetical protein
MLKHRKWLSRRISFLPHLFKGDKAIEPSLFLVLFYNVGKLLRNNYGLPGKAFDAFACGLSLFWSF